MKHILKKYILANYSYTSITITYFDTNGSNCDVHFYFDGNKYMSEKLNINIWDLVLFLHETK
jgi:hypothetical protein